MNIVPERGEGEEEEAEEDDERKRQRLELTRLLESARSEDRKDFIRKAIGALDESMTRPFSSNANSLVSQPIQVRT